MGSEWLMTAGAVLGALLALILLRKMVGTVLRILLRTAVGGGVLALLAPVGGMLGLNLGVNLYNALVIGILGAPGLGLLMLLNWLLAQS